MHNRKLQNGCINSVKLDSTQIEEYTSRDLKAELKLAKFLSDAPGKSSAELKKTTYDE